MKRLLFSLFLLCLTLLVVRAQVTIYGFSTNSEDNTLTGLVKCSSDNPAESMERVKVIEEWATAGAWGGDAYYVMLKYATYPKGLYTIDIETGEAKQVADYMYKENVRGALDMTYDYTNETMYMICTSDVDNSHTAFGKVDLKTGEQTLICTDMRFNIVAIAANKDGVVYAISDAGFVMTVDKTTGLCTKKYTISGCYPFRRQSMEFDRKTGDLYWAYCDSDDFGLLKKLNVKKRTVTDLGYIGGQNQEQVLGLYIPYSLCEEGSPNKVTNLTLTPDADGEKAATLRWISPVATYAGDTLKSISKIEIYRDDALVHTLTDASPGVAVEWTDSVPDNATYTYKILPYNEEGAGVHAVVYAFVGHDLPMVPTIASVVRVGDNAVRVDWNPVTEGANGGYVDLSTLTYNIVRTSDGSVLAEGLTDTTYTDTGITDLARYQYSVQACNADGMGETALTGYIVNGPARELPIVTDFTDAEESKLWSIADANGDGQTFFWQYNANFLDQGFYYYQADYAPSNANDWILSPKYKFESGKHYKAIVNVRPCNTYQPEMMEIYLVKNYDLSTAVNLGDTIHVTGETDENGDMIISEYRLDIAPLDEAAEYSVGVRCISNMEVSYWLGVAKVEVSENQEGHIRGDVYDNELNPVEGVMVSLEGTDYKTVTDVRGQFELKNVPEGTYTTVQTKLGYFSQPQTVNVKGLATVNVELDVVKRKEYTYKGMVKNEYGEALSGVSVALSGYNEYATTTDVEGNFLVDGVYELDVNESGYFVRVDKDFYLSDTVSFHTADVNGDGIVASHFTLDDLVLPPALVTVAESEDAKSTIVNWTKPGMTQSVAHYSTQWSGSFGANDGDAGTLIGVLCYDPFLLDSIRWVNFSKDSTVNLVIRALNSRGRITARELYRDDAAANIPYEETVYALKEKVYAPNGCFIGLSVDSGNVGLTLTYATEEKPFVPQTNAYIDNSESDVALYFLEEAGYEENLFVGYHGQKVAGEGAPEVTYNVVAMAGNTELHRIVGTDFTYTDPAWADLDKGEYQYAVEAVYRNGQMVRTLSDVLDKTTPSNIENVRSNDACVTLVNGTMLVQASAVVVVSSHGKIVVEGSDLHAISTNGWTGGIYLVRTLNDGVWETTKIVIK